MRAQNVFFALCVVGIAMAATRLKQPVPRDFTWILVLEIIQTLITAWGIGANDVANNLAAAVGSKSLTLRQAVLVAAICEFCGATFMGASVTSTVRKGIVDPAYYVERPEFFMLGMWCADTATGIWLALATKWKFPVSTTHSVVGAIVGFGVATYGTESVKWGMDGIGKIVISWVTAPLSAGVIAAVLFFLVRTFILRSENAFERALRLYPVIMVLTLWVNLFFMMYKGAAVFKKLFKTIPVGFGLLICLGVAAAIGIPAGCILVPLIRKRVNSKIEAEAAAEQADEPSKDMEKGSEVPDEAPKKGGMFAARDTHEEALKDGFLGEKAKTIHENAEVFDVKAEYTFNWLQVITACFSSFAHGANDVANAVGTLAACYGVWNLNAMPEGKTEVPIWILALGGVGISTGLATWGYKIIETLGVQLVKITPCRGFCMQLATSICVIVSSIVGAPVSTTQVAVGSTVGVGLVDGRSTGVNWWLFGKIFLGWCITLVIAGGISAGLTAILFNSPSISYYETISNATLK